MVGTLMETRACFDHECVSARLTECVTGLYLDRLLSALIVFLLPACAADGVFRPGDLSGHQAKSISVDAYRQQEPHPHVPASTSKSSSHLAKQDIMHIMHLEVILPKGKHVELHQQDYKMAVFVHVQ